MRPTPRMLTIMVGGLFVAALPLVFLPSVVLVGVFWLGVLIATLVDLGSLLRMRTKIRVSVPRIVPVGEPVEAEVYISSALPRALSGLLRLEVDEPLRLEGDVEVPVEQGELRHTLVLRTSVRGTGRVVAAWLRSRGPVGLLDRIDRSQVDLETAVVPNAAMLSRALELRLARPLYRIGHRPHAGHGEGTEFDSLQAYVAGMDMRQIDWKSSARHHSLRVRRYTEARDQRVVVCLDTGRLMGAPIEALQRLDHAIHTALVLSQVALRGRDMVGLHAYAADPGVWVQPGAGPNQLARLRRACAVLHTENVETNHALGLHSVLSRLERRSLVIVFTDFTDSTMAELMIEYLEQLARRHLVVFVALDDPVVNQPWAVAPIDVEKMAAAVMTSEIQQARHRVLRQLEMSGIRVVHGKPGEAALRVLNQYLDIKRRGLLG